MKLPVSAGLVLCLGLLSGCCSFDCCVSSCDPCGRDLVGGNPFKGMFSKKCNTCDVMVPCYHGGPVFAGGCATGQCGAPAMPAAAGCGCGLPHGMPHGPAPLPPAMVPPPAPLPQQNQHHSAPPAPVPAVPPAVPGPPSDDFSATGQKLAPIPQPVLSTATAPMSVTPTATAPAPLPVAPPHQVSYEEFQRLPGVVISNTVSAAPATPNVPPVRAPQTAATNNTWAPTR